MPAKRSNTTGTTRKPAAKNAAKRAKPKQTARKSIGKTSAPKANKPASATRTSTLQVVYVHGEGPQPDAGVLRRAWDVALFGKHLDGEAAIAYWADILNPIPARESSRITEPDDIEATGVADISPEWMISRLNLHGTPREDALRYVRQIDPISELSVSDRVSVDTAPLEMRKSSSHAATPLPGWARRPRTVEVTRHFQRDSAAYFFAPSTRKRIQDRVRAVLGAAKSPIVIVAHGLGAVIAYDVLHALRGKVAVRLLVTIGAPLGSTIIHERLATTGALRFPPNVDRWANVADPIDPISSDKWCDAIPSPEPPALVQRRSIENYVVFNRRARVGDGFNPHASTGYFDTPLIREIVQRSLVKRANPLEYGRLVRRDVLARMPDRVSRHSVLLEARDPETWPEAEGNKARDDDTPTKSALVVHREGLVGCVEKVVKEISGESAIEDANIDQLKRYVSARLTSAEIEQLTAMGIEHLWAVWLNSRKKKLSRESSRAIHAEAGRATFAAAGGGITWAVLDTGVFAAHPHFRRHRNIKEVLDATKRGAVRPINPSLDEDGHGTHVCGIIAGDQGPQRRRDSMSTDKISVGIAPETNLVVYKVLNDHGEGDDAWIIKALEHIADRNDRSSQLAIHGVNLSLGSWFDPEVYGCGYSPVCQELRRLWRQGVVVCVACGNEGQVDVVTPAIDGVGEQGTVTLSSTMSIGDPANLEDCIAVGSVNAIKPHLYGISHFSSRGPTADGRAKPDLVAPGENIWSCSPDGDYIEESGTSMACPHVSGLIAAFLSVRREFIGRPDEVKQRLLASCEDLGRDRYHQGAGLPSLLRMLSQS
jgi:subtilisin family serine protease